MTITENGFQQIIVHATAIYINNKKLKNENKYFLDSGQFVAKVFTKYFASCLIISKYTVKSTTICGA